ncbi:hypothetical protein AB205_0100030 [Aquarana catesbeiana]|uniref:Tubulin--tyrosine ligase-like protein 12 SET-like domain-containing protein n=1 Tax=Aquarana catesbeiana TaxID=8400 RepID=A0A2G9S1N4_AQUCT|nr:hypothetical protein AB205_0100030 [Aquarana catesbeiana]
MAEPGYDQQDEGYSQFVVLHQAALNSSGVPPVYWKSLHRKLEGEIFDAGEWFGIMQVEEMEEEDEDTIEIEREQKKKANPGNDIFLIDHAWTYRVEHARRQLMEVPGLLHRMANLMGMEFHGEVPDEGVVEDVLTEMWKYNQTYQLSQGVAYHV